MGWHCLYLILLLLKILKINDYIGAFAVTAGINAEELSQNMRLKMMTIIQL